MEANLVIMQIENIFEGYAGIAIDWSARPMHIASYLAAADTNVDLSYDFSPLTDDAIIAGRFWDTFDNVYRAILTMLDLGTWERVRSALAIDRFDEVAGDVAYAAIQASYQF